MNFLPQVSTENLNQGDLESWDFTMHKDTSQVKLHLETDVNLENNKNVKERLFF
jgi:hypothetical protein